MKLPRSADNPLMVPSALTITWVALLPFRPTRNLPVGVISVSMLRLVLFLWKFCTRRLSSFPRRRESRRFGSGSDPRLRKDDFFRGSLKNFRAHHRRAG